MMFLKLVPFWAWALAAMFAWGAHGHYKATQEARDRAQTAVRAAAQLRDIEAQKQAQVRAVEAQYETARKETRRIAADLRSTNQRLQGVLAQPDSPRDSATVCGDDGERGRALERLLAESAGLAEEGARRVGELTDKTSALQEYVASVCTGQKNADH